MKTKNINKHDTINKPFIKRYFASDLVGVHPIMFRQSPEGDCVAYDDIKDMVEHIKEERDAFMGQFDILEFMKKYPGKRFTITEMKKIFKLNNCSVPLRKLNMYGLIRSEPAPKQKGRPSGIAYYYEKVI